VSATSGPSPRSPEPGPPAATQVAAAGAIDAHKVYGEGDTEVRALDGVTVSFERSRFTAIMGPSGSGKSTLMHCLAGLDRLSSGRVFIGETYLDDLSEGQLTELRRDKIGFVFQAFNLIPTLSAAENITLPMDLAGRDPDTTWMNQVIDTVGLRSRLSHRPSELSGGQQQRVAVARALASRPEIVFADEPTGNLDPATSVGIMKLLDRINRVGTTVIMATHDAAIVDQMRKRVIELDVGQLVRDEARGVYGQDHQP